jgi:hypothetical protein
MDSVKGTIQVRDDTSQRRHVFLFYWFFGGFSFEKIILRITIYSNIFIFITVTNNIYRKQIKYHVFNAVMNSELTELVPVFTIRPAFPTSVKKVSTSFKNVWRTWGPALPTLLTDLMIYCPLGLIGPTNFKTLLSTHESLYLKVPVIRLRSFLWVIKSTSIFGRK